MPRDDLDRLLADEDIVPSSGFVARVMDAVRVEAAAPPAIPFPWSRALPGIIAAVVTLLTAVAGFFVPGISSLSGTTPLVASSPAAGIEVAWVLVVLLLSAVPVVLSLRITRGQL